MQKTIIRLILLVLLPFVNISTFADDSSSGGGTGGGVTGGMSGSGISGNNFGGSIGNFSSGSSSGSNSPNITINGGAQMPMPSGQTQIIGSNILPATTQKDYLNNGYLGSNSSYNSYNDLTNGRYTMQMMPNGGMVYVPEGNPILPDDFQRNVQLRTGLALNKYGYDLFNDPQTFAPIDDVPASNDYILGPGDQITLKAWGSIDIDYASDIDKEGNIFIPQVGKISLIGVKSSNLDSYLKAKISRIYRNFSSSASISKIRSIQVNVTGFATKPGTYTLSSLTTLTNAIFASGGPSAQGSLRDIQLKRDGQVIANYDMYDLLLNGNDNGDIRLLSGDIIYIKPYGSEVAIYEGVKVPGIYEARDGESVADLVRFAGGYTFDNTKNTLIVEKINNRQKIDVFNYSFLEGLKQKVANGEIIHFFKMANDYDQSIVLIGNITNPSRYTWHKGLRIKDIIPNKKMLLTKSFWNSYNYNTYAKDTIMSQSGLEKTNNWSSTNPQTSDFSSGLNSTVADGSESSSADAFGGGDNLFTAGPIQIPEADINWHYAVIIRLNPDNFRSELIPFDLEQAIAGDKDHNLELQPGDVINILSSKDIRTPARKGVVYVFIDGEVNRPGAYELEPGQTLVDAIKTAGGITPDAYLYGMELDRQSVKLRQKAALSQMLDNLQQTLLSQANNSVSAAISPDEANMQNQILTQQQVFINKLRQLKPSGRVVLSFLSDTVKVNTLPTVTLENGDTIYVPPKPNTIDVIGQVYNPATFIYSRDETVGDYLDEAGTTNNFADTSGIYVLHADGTLYSKQQSGWFSAFNSQHLYAGDAIVVPQKIQFDSLTKNLIDWTQILANFGLGVAAIQQLKNNS